MRIVIIYCGDSPTEYYKTAISDYEKRLSAFCTVDVVRIKEEGIDEKKNPSAAVIEKALDAEGERILSAIPKGAFTVAMCIEGKQLSSVELSETIYNKCGDGVSTFAFIIGSSYGISQRVKNASSLRLSMSKMTFPHQLARLMLTEQLYRAVTIQNGKKYHK